MEAGYSQSDVNLLRQVDVVLLGPVAHEPRLNVQENVGNKYAADKQYPKRDWVCFTQIVHKQLHFISSEGTPVSSV